MSRIPDLLRDELGVVDERASFEDLGLDSLDVFALVQKIETERGARFADELVPHLKTVEDLLGAAAVEVKIEAWDDVLNELEALFPAHWREIALYQAEIPMQVNSEHYRALERLGSLILLTARSAGKLVGYFLGYVLPGHPHYHGAGAWGVTDMYFVLPEHRHGAGLQLFFAFEEECRRRGCIQAVTSTKLHQDHSELLGRLGWEWTDKTLQKHLGK